MLLVALQLVKVEENCMQALWAQPMHVMSSLLIIQDEHDKMLEDHRDMILHQRVLVIQRYWRGFIQRRKFLRLKVAALMVAKNWKRIAARRRYLKVSEICCANYKMVSCIICDYKTYAGNRAVEC